VSVAGERGATVPLSPVPDPVLPWSRQTVAWWAAVLTAALFVCPLLLDLPLLDPDEGLHAAIALEMVERGDYVTPRFLGEPFLDKPVLFFWAQAASLKVFGVSEVAIRIAGLGFGWLGALTTGLLAWRLAGRATGCLAAACYATLLLPAALSQAAVHDVALVPWTNLALLGLWEAGRSRATARTLAWSAFAGLWLGLAILTKGLAGVAVVGIATAIWMLGSRRLRPATIAGGLVALLLGGLVAAPWYVAMDAANPGYLHYFFVERHWLGYATTTQPHGQRAWWYYLPVLAAGALPWILALPLARPSPEAPARDAGDAPVLLWSWLTGGLAFFSLAKSKLVTYVLPLFPAVAVLAAMTWVGWIGSAGGRPPPRRAGMIVLAQAALMAVAVVGAATVATVRFEVSYGAGAWLTVGCLAVAWLALPPVVWWRIGPGASAGVILALTCATVPTGLLVVLPPVAHTLTARDLARTLNAQGRFPARLWLLDERVGSLVFYLDPTLRHGLTPDRIVNVGLDAVLGMRRPPEGTVIVVPVERLDRLTRRVDLAGVPFTAAGHHRIYSGEALFEALGRAVGR
jgi:4-amino-4-deoxy-L-arabinose transferase-like glycosyltransferase